MGERVKQRGEIEGEVKQREGRESNTERGEREERE